MKTKNRRKLARILAIIALVSMLVPFLTTMGCALPFENNNKVSPTPTPDSKNPFLKDVSPEPTPTNTVAPEITPEVTPGATIDDLISKYGSPTPTPTPIPTAEPTHGVEATPTPAVTETPKATPTPAYETAMDRGLVTAVNLNCPSKVIYGGIFNMRGEITIIDKSLTSIYSEVCTLDGKSVMKITDTIAGKDYYNIYPSKLNKELVFGKLAVGSYAYKVYVADNMGNTYTIIIGYFDIVKEDAEYEDAKGLASVRYEGKAMDVTVTIGGDALTGKNKRLPVLNNDEAVKLLPKELKNATETGWDWRIVHIRVEIDPEQGVGCYNDCVPEIIIRAANGTKMNSSNIPYYELTLDKNNKNYSNSSSYVKNYDIAFQMPIGIKKFNIIFGNGDNQFVYSYSE